MTLCAGEDIAQLPSVDTQPPPGFRSVTTLQFVLLQCNFWMLPKHDAIGEVRLPVCQMDLAQAKEIWKDLQSIVGDGKVSPQTNKAIPWTASKASFEVKNQYLLFKKVLCKRAY